MADQNDPWADFVEVGPSAPTLQERKGETDITQGNASAASSEATASRTRQMTPAEVREAFAKAQSAELKATTDREDRDRAKRTKQFQIAQDTDNVLSALAQARGLVSGWSTGWGSMLKDIPSTEARSLHALLGPDGPVSGNTMLSRITQLKAASENGAAGLGALSNAEGAKLSNSITSLDLGRKPEEVLDAINTIERHYRRFAAFERGENPDIEDVAIRYGIIPEPDARASGGEPPAIGGVTGATGDEDVATAPGRKGLNSVVSRMLQQGRSSDQIKAYLDSVEPGLGAKTSGLDWWADYYAQPRDRREPLRVPDVNIEALRTKTSGLERGMGAIADSAPGAALIAAGDVFSGGMLDDMTANPAATRAAMKGAELDSPSAYLGGQIAAGIGQGMGIEGLAAKYGLKLGPAALGALQSGAYGYGSSEATGVDAALDGGKAAALGAVIGKGGDVAGRTVGRTVRGIDDLSARYLHDMGVPMTVGEMVGGGLRRFEDKMANVPLVGTAIRDRLTEGTEAFNQAALSEALAPLAAKYRSGSPEIGAVGVRKARGTTQQAFRDALDGVTLAPDKTYSAGLQQALTDLAGVRDVGPRVLDAVNDRMGDLLRRTTVRRKTGWQPRPRTSFSGDEMQEALRSIDKVRGQFASNEMFGSSIAPRLDALEGEIRGLVNRQAPDVLPAYDAARAAWRRNSVVADAVETASKRTGGDERGVFTPHELSDAGIRNAERFGGRNASVTQGNYPLQQLAEAGQDVLSPRTSGGAGAGFGLPLTAGAGAGALSYLMQPESVNPQTGEIRHQGSAATPLLTGAGVASLLAFPYSRGAQAGAQKMLMAPRSTEMERLGDLILKYAPGAGRSAGAIGGASSMADDVPSITAPDLGRAKLPPALPTSAPTEEPVSGSGYAIEIDGVRIPLGEGDWYDRKTDELVAADGTRMKRSALVGQ